MEKPQLPCEADVSSVSDLLVYSLEEWVMVALQKGGVQRLLNEKWCKIYKANFPRCMFTHNEAQHAA